MASHFGCQRLQSSILCCMPCHFFLFSRDASESFASVGDHASLTYVFPYDYNTSGDVWNSRLLPSFFLAQVERSPSCYALPHAATPLWKWAHQILSSRPLAIRWGHDGSCLGSGRKVCQDGIIWLRLKVWVPKGPDICYDLVVLSIAIYSNHLFWGFDHFEP